jgi:SAM-dependent methyltransferase
MPELDDWPAAARRRPSRGEATWSIRAALAAWLQEQAADASRTFDGGRYRVLDVGCGVKPYYPFFRAYAGEYVGVDPQHPDAEVKGTVEDIPLPDGSFDVVLCTQVLEHCGDPARAVQELRRVTAPGGRVLSSTHGVMVYHPNPDDFWRWTHAGLRQLFERNGSWERITVTPNAGTASCVATLLAVYVNLLGERAHVRPLGRGAVHALNRLGPLLDRSSRILREPVPGSLFSNFHVRAEVPV